MAEAIGRKLKGGETIELISDLGGGKTAFVTGLAKGIGSTDQVSSPSFTINQIYSSPRLQLNHYDMYRLQDPGIMKLEIHEATTEPNTIVAIEWGENVRDILPTDRISVHISAPDITVRDIRLEVPPSLAYAVEGISS